MKRPSRTFAPAALSASFFVLAGAGAMALTDDAPLAAQIKDIRVGERDMQTRIALFCEGACEPVARGDAAFFIAGAGDDFVLDISDAGSRARSIEAISRNGGSAIVIEFDGDLAETAAGPCTVGGRKAACLDLFFEKRAEAVTEPDEIGAKTPGIVGETEPETALAAAAPSAPAAVIAPPRPGLRETAGDRYDQFASLASPERLEAPILAKVQPIREPVPVEETPAMRPNESFSAVEQDFSGRIETLLGKNLTPAYCNNADATLQAGRVGARRDGPMLDCALRRAAMWSKPKRCCRAFWNIRRTIMKRSWARR